MKCKLYWLVCVSVFLVTSAGATPIEWETEEGGNGHWYEVVLVPSGIDWEAANIAAMGLGGHLATITSSEENAFVYNLVSSDSDFWTPGRSGTSVGPWLGGFQPEGSPEPDGNWQWVTGEPFIFTAWETTEPNNHNHGGFDNRLHFLGKYTPMAPEWNDLYAFDEIAPLAYVVEFVPEPATLSLLALGGVALLRRGSGQVLRRRSSQVLRCRRRPRRSQPVEARGLFG